MSFAQKKLDLIDIIVLVFYYIFVCFSFLAFFGFFNRFWVYFILGVLFLSLLYFRKFIIFNKKYLWFFIMTSLVVVGFGLLRGFFAGDAIAYWLPFAREIAQTGQMPSFLSNMEFVSRMPLLFLLFAATFSIFGSFSEFLVVWLPLFFSSATLFLICYWLSKKDLEKKYIVFAIILFLANSLVAFAGWNLLQESLLLFFFTAFFYYYEKFSESKKQFDLVLLILSFVLAIASKFTGLFLVIPLFFLFFKVSNKKKFILFLIVLSTPILFWFLRNYLIFGNPIFPLLSSVFKDKYYFLIKDSVFLHPLSEGWNLASQILFSLKRLLLVFPFIILALYGFLKEKRIVYFAVFIFFFLIEEFVYFSISSGARYYFPFLGLLIVYGLIGLRQLKSKLAFSSVFLIGVWGLFLIPFTYSSSDFISGLENKFSFFGSAFEIVYNNHLIFLLLLAPVVYFFIAKHKDRNYLLVFLYALYILGLSFVANKSWLNAWSSIFLGLIVILILGYFSKIRTNHLKKIVIVVISLIVFLNSWGLAAIYYWNQDQFAFPAPFVYASSKKTAELLDDIEGENRDFYVLSDGTGYLIWYKNYKALNFNVLNFKFNLITKMGYQDDSTSTEVKDLFIKSKIKYVWDDGGNEYMPEKGKRLLQKIRESDDFQLIYQGDEGRLFKTY